MKSWFGELHEYKLSEGGDESLKMNEQKSNLLALMNS